ncbi:DUF29 domain-containing protein [Methylacidimicrobium tartarophylax]|uniref:DUF29 domain-containing protein n=1 Tax=Methylacidimicrobium tartarophylax TaxID=1041768 RepID=A0A5E6M7U9_9BACT|nr:DUF29 domain-containing protein [Methylacidimicrobium tartarophylax]VVM04460.1 hypothetical protein MAMT_00092 [Methylacidimicrobium tartarophylax]
MKRQKLYDRDFYAWTVETARLLRERRFAELDIDDLIEEVETLGRSERSQLKSRLVTLMQHLLCIAYLTRDPEREGWGWKATVIEQRMRLVDLLEDNPSLEHQLEDTVAEAYSSASELLIVKSREMARPIAKEDLSQTCPWTVRELLTKDLYLSRSDIERRMEPPRFRM